jgi:hypothetical protein
MGERVNNGAVPAGVVLQNSADGNDGMGEAVTTRSAIIRAWGIACWNPARKPVEGTDRSYAANGLEAC